MFFIDSVRKYWVFLKTLMVKVKMLPGATWYYNGGI